MNFYPGVGEGSSQNNNTGGNNYPNYNLGSESSERNVESGGSGAFNFYPGSGVSYNTNSNSNGWYQSSNNSNQQSFGGYPPQPAASSGWGAPPPTPESEANLNQYPPPPPSPSHAPPPSTPGGNQYPGSIAPPSPAPQQSPYRRQSPFNWYPGGTSLANYRPVNTRNQRDRATSWYNPLRAPKYPTHRIPEGYQVRHTNTGMPYLVDNRGKIQGEEEEDEDWEPPKLFSSSKKIREAYGLGVWLYFDFVWNFIFVNFLFFIIQLINFINFVVIAPEEFAEISLNPNVYGSLFYSSAYPPSLRVMWTVTNSMCVALALLYPLIYWIRVRRIYGKLDEVDTEEEMDLNEFDEIEENKDFTRRERLKRRAVTYSLFIFFLLVQIGGVSLLILGQNSISYIFLDGSQISDSSSESESEESSEGSSVASSTENKSGEIQSFISSRPVSYTISAAVALVTGGLNFLWGYICLWLTKYEKHPTWTILRKHHTVKLVSFKLLNIFFMSAVRGIFTQRCPLEVLGKQYLLQMFADLLLFNAIEMGIPYAQLKWKQWREGEVEEKDKPEFDTSDEYLEVLYRQHILYLALPAFPMITFLVFIASILELYLDKYRLIKICQRPPRTQGSIKTFLALFLLIAALLALGNPGSGVLYMLVGKYWCVRGEGDPPCSQQDSRHCLMMGSDPSFTVVNV
eukprot:gb/GECH01011946.1/.p1 GENE.gb/GECH01011946.1/~~gb/GECH01011946.1/.p1  ORF type:complete len:683 (+),score=139.05 gb/GECH01011946.1/:1-2049(+)